MNENNATTTEKGSKPKSYAQIEVDIHALEIESRRSKTFTEDYNRILSDIQSIKETKEKKYNKLSSLNLFAGLFFATTSAIFSIYNHHLKDEFKLNPANINYKVASGAVDLLQKKVNYLDSAKMYVTKFEEINKSPESTVAGFELSDLLIAAEQKLEVQKKKLETAEATPEFVEGKNKVRNTGILYYVFLGVTILSAYAEMSFRSSKRESNNTAASLERKAKIIYEEC